MKPYIVLYSFDTHGFETLKPVFDVFVKEKGVDVTLLLPPSTVNGVWKDCHVSEERRIGLQANGFRLGNIYVARQPSVLVGFRLWWEPDSVACQAAVSLNIPVVMMNHGSMYIYDESQAYKENLGGARAACIWGEHDLQIWKIWNTKNRFVITGNPLHDQLINYKCPLIDVPDEFALLLTCRHQYDFLDESAAVLSKKFPVIAKCHPIDERKEYYEERYRVFTSAESLIPLLYKCKFVLSNVSSALQPAMFFSKPIFIHSYAMEGYHFDEFKMEHENDFNFKQDTIWDYKTIEQAIKPTIRTYTHFGYLPDGNNSKRVKDVIMGYL